MCDFVKLVIICVRGGYELLVSGFVVPVDNSMSYMIDDSVSGIDEYILSKSGCTSTDDLHNLYSMQEVLCIDPLS